MKKVSLLISLVVTVVFLSRLTCGARAATQENASTYISVVQQAIEECWGTGYGALYDVDGNGIEELIMLYTVGLEKEDGSVYPAKVCSVYTMDNGKALRLIDKEKLFIEAGGPSGYAAVVENDGSTYLAITHENGETAGEYVNRGGEWNLYTINGATVELTTNVEYDYFREDEILYDKSTAMINGQNCSFKEYENWKKGLKEVFKVDANGLEDDMSLKELLEYLETTPASKTDNIVHSGTCGENAKWTLSKAGVLSISGAGEMYDYEFESAAPWEELNVKKIVIEEGITSIGEEAFLNLSSVEEVDIADSVEKISYMAFANCDQITDLILPDSITELSGMAIVYCDGLQSITIPKDIDITQILLNGDINLLRGNTNLVNIYISKNSSRYCDIDGVVYDKGGETLIHYPVGRDTVSLDSGVRNIGEGAFQGCYKLEGLELPEGVETIGPNALYAESVYIPGTVKYIDDSAFSSYRIKNIVLADNNEYYCIENDTLFDKEKTILYRSCNKQEYITIPDTVTKICNRAFYNSPVKTINIPRSVREIGTEAFMSCTELVEVSLPKSITTLGERTFGGCTNLSSVELNCNINVLPRLLFHFCQSLTRVEIPEGVEVIEEHVFTGAGVQEIVIPKSVEEISLKGVASAENLTDIYYCSDEEDFKKITCFATTVGGSKVDHGMFYEELEEQYDGEITLHYEYRPISSSFSLTQSTWSFANYYTSFAEDPDSHAEDYYIPEERYNEVYGEAFVDAILSINTDWKGNCAGMTSTAILYYLDLLDWDEFVTAENKEGEWTTVNSYCEDYKYYDNNKNSGYATSGYNSENTRLIEAYQLYINSLNWESIIDNLSGTYYSNEWKQNEEGYVKEHISGLENGGTYISSMLDEFKKAYEDNMPLLIILQYNKGGHAIVSRTDRKPEDMGDGWWRVYIYDPNKPYVGASVNEANEGYAFGCNALLASGEDVYLELNPEKNIWRYCTEVESISDTDYIGSSLSNEVNYRGYTDVLENITKTDNAKIPEYFFTVDLSKLLLVDYSNPTYATTASWRPDCGLIMRINSHTNLKVYDEEDQLVAIVIGGRPIVLTDEGYAINYIGNSENSTGGQLQLLDMDYSIEYISGEVTILSNDNAISFAADAEMQFDVDMNENLIQITAGDAGSVSVKCSNIYSNNECSYVKTTGCLAEKETLEFGYSDQNKVIANTDSKDGQFVVYQKSVEQIETVQIEVIESNNYLWLWLILGGTFIISISIISILVVMHKKSRK